MKRFMRTVKGNEGSFPECIKAMSLGEMPELNRHEIKRQKLNKKGRK